MRNLTKVDLYLNEWLLHTCGEIDRLFYLDGVKEWQTWHQRCCDYDKFMAVYMPSRWWVFSSSN